MQRSRRHSGDRCKRCRASLPTLLRQTSSCYRMRTRTAVANCRLNTQGQSTFDLTQVCLTSLQQSPYAHRGLHSGIAAREYASGQSMRTASTMPSHHSTHTSQASRPDIAARGASALPSHYSARGERFAQPFQRARRALRPAIATRSQSISARTASTLSSHHSLRGEHFAQPSQRIANQYAQPSKRSRTSMFSFLPSYRFPVARHKVRASVRAEVVETRERPLPPSQPGRAPRCSEETATLGSPSRLCQ